MVFDFRSTSGTIYVDTDLNRWSNYKMIITSLYNNKGINNTIGDIPLTRSITPVSSRFTTFTFDFSGDPDLSGLVNLDVNGYYKVRFYGDDGGRAEILATYPCKIITNYSDETYKRYVSDNEDNEQYTYYKS
jgi:hypothetical protein